MALISNCLIFIPLLQTLIVFILPLGLNFSIVFSQAGVMALWTRCSNGLLIGPLSGCD
jgi:hypothetical protein